MLEIIKDPSFHYFLGTAFVFQVMLFQVARKLFNRKFSTIDTVAFHVPIIGIVYFFIKAVNDSGGEVR